MKSFLQAAGLAALVSVPMHVEAATVTVRGDRNMTPAQWGRLVDQAGDGGEIRFEAGTITATGTLDIRRPITVSGAGRGVGGTRVEIAGNRRALFRVRSSNIRLRGMSMGGVQEPTFDRLLDSDGRISEGVRATTGLESAIFLNGNAFVNLRVLRCRINNTNVGIEMRRGATPDGMEVRGVDFTVTRGMILANGASVPGGRLNRPFLIENCRMVNRDGAPSNANRPLTIRGIVFDFGNENEGEDFDPVDMNGSVIRNCRFLSVSNWQIGMTQTSNLIIEGNRLPGGGVMRDSFVHCLHFEDVGDPRNPIVIRDNTMTQRQVRRAVAHVWAGGNTASGGTALRIENNRFGGISNSLVLIKRPVNQAPRNLRFAHTVGNDVPSGQQRRRNSR